METDSKLFLREKEEEGKVITHNIKVVPLQPLEFILRLSDQLRTLCVGIDYEQFDLRVLGTFCWLIRPLFTAEQPIRIQRRTNDAFSFICPSSGLRILGPRCRVVLFVAKMPFVLAKRKKDKFEFCDIASKSIPLIVLLPPQKTQNQESVKNVPPSGDDEMQAQFLLVNIFPLGRNFLGISEKNLTDPFLLTLRDSEKILTNLTSEKEDRYGTGNKWQKISRKKNVLAYIVQHKLHSFDDELWQQFIFDLTLSRLDSREATDQNAL